MSKTRIVVTGVAAFAAVAAIGACSNAATKEASSSTTSSPAQSTSAAPAAAHNQADMMFARMMIPHHQQAIQMSDMIFAKQGIDPRVVDLAKQIKAAQGPEIDQMQGWLKQWGMPGMSGMPGMDDMPGMNGTPGNAPSDHGGMHGSDTATASPTTTATMPMPMPSGSTMPGMGDMPGMDGMMSPADMQALQSAQGVEASKLYLTQMIKHHQGAITMAQNEIKNGQFPDAIALAKSIATSQQKEIDTMNQILSTL
ncbi:DUF305 domain-containing protein [Mycobacterium crocinum]|uniref:DUF305 domain-containing protein n=1 Tax=Mycolicibacterium crocinum TaxID=388459 RepID=A0ABY3TW94_9MYCO|nr:DUF305 domain-containing protein [Mycolicibacterium crocinum]MCV7218357.1 DUF305 domain-containing protein [Mycolicibacterium crocinum]ULN43385.1 DUF305 domain-containing protein [Mycolicibacterium crocinum]